MTHYCFSRASLLGAAVIASALTLACGAGIDSEATVEIAKTQHPLVARYSFTSRCGGAQGMVEFGPDTSYGRQTAWQRSPGIHQRTDILVAGMKAATTYHMRSTVRCAGDTWTSADQTFTTGALPSTPFPSLTVSRPDSSLAAAENPGIELMNVFAPNSNLLQGFFADRDGNPIWFYDVGAASGNAPYTMKLLPNGHIIFSITRSITAGTIIREVDLSGKTIREMGTGDLDKKMQQAGFNFVPTGFHHDLLPLANGHLIVLVNFFLGFTDLPGFPGTTNVLGDGIVDLDQDWNPVWAWSAFDHLDVNRHPNGLPDWTHGNAVIYSPSDGDLLFSMRHQSWVVKIDYNNGAGSGNVLWKLGYQGDFSLSQGGDPSLWFYYQHYPSLISQNGPQATLAIWDNGNNRVMDNSGTLCSTPGSGSTNPCYSRAMVLSIDESTRVANLLFQEFPGSWSVWGGSIQQLTNGNLEFDMNAPFPAISNLASEVQEVTQEAVPQVVWKMDIAPVPLYAYRAYRVPSLYPGVTWQN
jgi:hypothetical protein